MPASPSRLAVSSPSLAERPLRRGARALPAAWHLLSLDAPAVAATWCLAFAGASGEAGTGRSGSSSGWASSFLILATWLCYVGDRILDARPSRDPSRLRPRHRFYGALWRERRGALLVALAIGTLACVAVGLGRLSPSLIAGYAVLSASSLVYFAWVHAGGARLVGALPKEAVVGAIFAAGCALPAWDASAAPVRASLAPAVGLFAALCWLNCVAIERWEGADGVPLDAHPSTRWASTRLGALLLVGMGAAGALGVLGRRDAPGTVLAPPLGVAFALLAVLDLRRRRIPAEGLRILADAALLTPVPWLVLRALR